MSLCSAMHRASAVSRIRRTHIVRLCWNDAIRSNSLSPSDNQRHVSTSFSRPPLNDETKAASAGDPEQSVRLSKLLSQHATNLSISRRQAEKLIQSGQVTMAGEVVRSAATLVDVSVLTKQQQPSTPILKVKGKPVFLDLQNDGHTKTAVSSNHDVPKVWAVHKLSGEVVSESDPHGRPSLMDRLKRSGVGRNNNNSRQKQQQYHLKPIGRLDMPTEGLILVTNDGGFARAMELPSSELHRVYRVRVHGKLTAYKLDRIRRGGIEYDDDHHHSSTRGAVRYGPMRVAVERPRKGTQHSTNTWVQVTCTEGKNRQIRNVFAALGLTVTRLIRIAYGDYKLDTIPKGMAIPVPYKPVATQKAKGAVTEKGIRNSSKRGRVGKASPVQWVSSVQARSMSTTTTISYSYASDTNDGQLASRQALQEDVLSKFPQDNLVYSFGYGSGVFSQTLMDAKRKHEGMLDLILVVDDTETFHTANLKAHPHHYASWLQWGGPSLISKVQREFPLGDADVLFHVVDDPVTMKYGVVDQQDLFRDLKNWESLYLAGRLQKPTLPLVDPSPDEFVDAQQQNLEAAVASALLLLSPSDDRSWSAFFRTIASLSYTGDFRMQVGGEDPQKLDKLVQAPGQLRRFQDLYQPILEPFEKEGVISCSFVETGDDSQFNTLGLEWDTNDTATHFFLRDKLPESFQNKLSPTVSDPVQFSDILASVLAATVTPAARHQSFKGIFTLGPMRSFHYARAKLSKGWLRK